MQTIVSNKAEFTNIIKEFLSEFHTGTLYSLSIEAVKQRKSLKQLAFIFGGIISALQRFYLETDGIEYSKDLIKELLYDAVGVDDIVILPTSKKIVYKKSLSKMTKEEASNFINSCIVWVDENTECNLPVGLRYLWTLHITDKEIENLLERKFPERDELYLTQVRKMRCLGCGKPAQEAHHIREGLYAKGKKNADYMTIPVCSSCHRIIHQLGEKTFLKGIENVLNGMDIEVFCKCLYQKIRNGYE